MAPEKFFVRPPDCRDVWQEIIWFCIGPAALPDEFSYL